MKLIADPDMTAWLGSRPAMEWDTGNSTKSQTKHRFTIADVESLRDAPAAKLRPISCRAMRRKEKEAYDGASD